MKANSCACSVCRQWTKEVHLRDGHIAQLEAENGRLREFANTIMYTSDGKRRSSLGLTFTKAIEDLHDALKEGG